MKKILLVFGTRPEAIKMAPLVLEFQKYSEMIETKVCVTAQHREMLDEVLDIFDITPDFDLNLMKKDQNLYEITVGVLTGMQEVLSAYSPDMICVHGDTTTASITTLSALYAKIPVAHIEAGLRSGDIYRPWPEEANRRVVGTLATLHFAPTLNSKENLLKENIPASCIYVTGNTVIDALYIVLKKIFKDETLREDIVKRIEKFYQRFDDSRKIVLITGHRREKFGDGMKRMCLGIQILAERYKDVDFIYPVHPNPNVKKPVYELLTGYENIYLVPPLDYEVFIYLMYRSYLVLTDSGGLQEEAPSLAKPVLVMRENTERPEALAYGTAKLVGTDTKKIVDEVSLLLESEHAYDNMSQSVNPYGDGTAAKQICEIISNNL